MFHNLVVGGAVFTIVASIIILTSIRDESIQPNRFDCRMLTSGWHPDVSPKIIDHCQKGVRT
jgi:hypothetical protein